MIRLRKLREYVTNRRVPLAELKSNNHETRRLSQHDSSPGD